MPVTNPVLLMVATLVVADVHGVVVAAVPVPVSWVVDPTHTANEPLMTAFITILFDGPDIQPVAFVTE